jgi:phosphatidylserine/phosphatidylglycerophosphate/cardiolipin synthase-like enzyme
VTVVAERAVETSGQLTFDGLSQVREKVPKARFYYWPMDRRSTTPSGKKGVLHAKCVICDEMSALVSSANLTDYALEQNMELGLVLRGGEVPRQLAAHFRRLIQQGDLVPWL